ncbi:MAG: glycosyltransferase, partial [Anaerolineae bacterium]|nr:glycosyltransferase [Anaerolineae bacterium]
VKLLVVVSSLDLTQPFSATPAWWQLLKALYEEGAEVIATPYQGPAIESLWWRAAPNPAKFYGDSFQAARGILRRIAPPPAVQMSYEEQAESEEVESASDQFVRQTAQTIIAPLWQRHLDKLLTQEPDIDAVIFLTVPLNHLAGVPRFIQEKHNVPVLYFDGDVPASLPNMKGFASGFRIYQGADVTEYAAFISNSKGGEELLLQLGAKAAHTVWYGADPDVYAPIAVPEQDVDAFFFGHGREYRAQWIDAMISQPAEAMPEAHFAVRGKNLQMPSAVQELPYLSFSKLREYVCRSKLNLVITRAAHATLYASSSSRPFELAAMGACMVANPYNGIEEWFEPGKEVIVVQSGEEALERYQYLLSHDAERQQIARAARERLLKQHTFRHRARQLLQILREYV